MKAKDLKVCDRGENKGGVPQGWQKHNVYGRRKRVCKTGVIILSKAYLKF